MGGKACEAFRDVDELFINYETNEDEFNTSYGSYNRYCPVKKGSQRCETNSEKLNAIFGYAYTELMQNDKGNLDSGYDPSVDFLIMGLSNRLYKLSEDHSLSLKDAFGKYLGNRIGSFNHRSILYNKKVFMGYNIGIMNGFYLLFKQICETISISETPNAQPYQYIDSVTQCYIMYNTLYNFVNQCGPYLQLLDHLKTIYNEFIDAVIKYKNYDESLHNRLIKLSPIDKTKFGSEFNTKGCKKVNKKLEKNISRMENKPQDEQDEQDELNTLIELLGSDDDDDNDVDDADDDNDVDDGDDGLENNDDTTENSLDQIQNNQDGTSSGPGPGPQQGPQGQQAQKPAESPPQQPLGQPTSGQSTTGTQSSSDIQNGDSANPDTSQGGSGGGSDNGGSGVPGSSEGGSGGGPSGSGSPGGGSDSGSSGGSKAPGDPAATDSSGGSNGYWLSNWGSRFNPLNYLPSASEIYETQKSILTSASNKISDAYNSAVTTVKDTYDITMTAVKDTYDSAVIAVKNTYDSAVTNINYAYTTSTNYISGAVSSITNQLSSLGTFSQLGDDLPQLGGSGNSLPTDNTPPSTTQIPKSDPNSPSLPSSPPLPSMPQSPSPSVTSPPSQDPPQAPLQDPSSQKKLSSTHDSQDKVQNGASNIVQQPDPKDGKGGIKTLTTTQVTLLSSGISPSNIGNGSNPSGTDVKINEKPSIWCIGSNKKCDILGISIIGISIFVFLVIMYKYISFGSTKNSKKKKSMKRVIKYGDGTRKTQIIIKSYDRNKHLKPIINPVGRKKDPTLNIYKLMQADPVPFINLFFLLIFFVYKQKLNYLEL
ncbi:PIR protein CIR protein [Plasmodium vinckei petteri]|uniref:PIR protein CIR protein n=1 Tax=Plasmodium vinckei petteri TaxID=138298 RepID=A0A6V7T4Q6_PLAVN|nr:PIR protein CIR protein [Plasmodium vinckei petteri]